ncbi:MAG: DUF2085 domain-containing protein [Chloroflexia bacterium]
MSREDEVVQEARRQVEAHRRRRRGEEALRWCALWWAGVLLAFFLAPWPLADKVWAAVHGLCAQTPGHMLRFGTRELPLCARDSGIYLGMVLGTAFWLTRGRWRAAGRPARWFWVLLAAALAFFAVDALNSLADDWFRIRLLYVPDNRLRLASGLALGLVLAVLLLWAVHLSFRERQRERRIVAGWADLAGFLLLGIGGGLALGSGWPPLYLPLAALSVGGLVATLVVLNALLILTIRQGKRLLEGLWEAGRPLFWAGLLAVAEMALLSWLRYQAGG